MKKLPKLYIHKTWESLHKIGTIAGHDVYISLSGDDEQKETDYLLVQYMLQKAFGYPTKEDKNDPR